MKGRRTIKKSSEADGLDYYQSLRIGPKTKPFYKSKRFYVTILLLLPNFAFFIFLFITGIQWFYGSTQTESPLAGFVCIGVAILYAIAIACLIPAGWTLLLVFGTLASKNSKSKPLIWIFYFLALAIAIILPVFLFCFWIYPTL